MEFFLFWLECFLAAVIPANILVISFQFIKCSYKKNSFKNILDDRILQLERIAYKGQPTKEECLTLQIELPEVCLF